MFVRLLFALGVGLFWHGVAVAQSNGCPAGDYRLPNSKLCASSVASALPPSDSSFESGLELFGCRSVIWDAPLMDHIMVYRAAQCGQGKPASFSFGVGARTAGLDYIGGGLDISGGEDIPNFAIVVDSDPRAPLVALTNITKTGMEGSFPTEDIARCAPRREPRFGPGAWVVDDPVAARTASRDEPRSACGTYGYNEESMAYWHVTQGAAFFFDLGQDAYRPLDPGSIMIIGRNSAGRWAKVQDIAAASRAGTPPPKAWAPPPSVADQAEQRRANIRQIAGLPGVTERPYDQVRGWSVVAAFRDNAFAYCAGEVVQDGIRFRFGYDGAQWQVALNRGASADYKGQLVVDNQTWTMSGVANAAWTIGYISEQQAQAIGQGNLLILDIGRASFDLPLRGSEATRLKLTECYVEGGVKP